MQFRLTLVLGVIILTAASAGCAAEEARTGDAAEELRSANEADEAERLGTKATPVVGTWRWSGSGTKIGDVELGEEEFVFRDDGTYAVVSKAGDGSSECYEGSFTFSTAGEPGHGTIVFKNNHLRNAKEDGFVRDVVLDGNDTLHFGEGGGTYRRTGPVLAVRCP